MTTINAYPQSSYTEATLHNLTMSHIATPAVGVIINPQRAFEVRVTAVVLCVCLSI